MNKSASLWNEQSFLLGVNYWPRKSGVKMWREFDAAEIDREFAQIKEMGMDTVRVFPLWDDFQPIYELPSAINIKRTMGMRHDWNITPVQNPEMVDEEMLKRFDSVLESARKYNLKLIVALLTAWMSGTLFNPTWKGGRNLFADPFMLKFQMLYCRAFAKRYANCPEIIAWEYGNEQNCTDSCDSTETAWVWLHALAAELRLHDPKTPISSGMHGTVNVPGNGAVWTIEDGADALDLLTTHPYHAFTPGCFMEFTTDLRANLHATAESLYISDLGHRPVLCEETGTLGNSCLSEPLTAAFLRLRLYSLFANGLEGCLWWCYSDFACENELPYRDVQMENDGLGLTRTNGEIKPAGNEMTEFRKVVDLFKGKMPAVQRNAAILVSDLRDDWVAAYNCYVLCKQAGLSPKFVRPDQEDLSPYPLILAPSFTGTLPISVMAWSKVTEAVHAGAVLYVSGNGVSLSNMKELFGIAEMEKIPLQPATAEIRFKDFSASINARVRQILYHHTGEEMAWYPDGTPAMVKHHYGKGTAFFLSMPLEASMANENFAFQESEAWKLYASLKETANLQEVPDFPHPHCERTWNSDTTNHGYLTVINHKREAVEQTVRLQNDDAKLQILAGKGTLNGTKLRIEPLQAVILDYSIR